VICCDWFHDEFFLVAWSELFLRPKAERGRVFFIAFKPGLMPEVFKDILCFQA